MKKQTLDSIIKKHKKWLESERREGKRMDLKRAYFSGVDFNGADFSGADFSGADFSGVDFSGAGLFCVDLRRVDFSGANFSGANLSGANLKFANLNGANLNGADLSNVILWSTKGNNKEIKNIPYLDYNITYTKDILQIGCKNYSIEEWENFTDEEIDEMEKGESLAFWKKNKKYIFDTIKANPAE